MTSSAPRQFHIEACLGRGGFGEVYKARMVREGGFETRVAIKLLRGDVDPRSQAAQRLRDEARMLGMVRHRAIPAIYDMVVLDGRLALVAAYIQGIDFGRALRSDEPPSKRACVEVAMAVADALDAAYHAPVEGRIARIVHRDLKPANIRIAADGTTMLLDFGIAFTDAVTRVAETQSSALVGSPAYMAPERFEGTPPEPANDVFGLGAVLYEALVGRRLFGDVSFKTLAAISLFEDRYERALDTRMAEVPSDLPASLRHLLAAMLAWNPAARPDAQEVARTLEAITPELPGPSLAVWCRSRHGTPDNTVEGAWVGRVLTEGSTHAPPPPAEQLVLSDATPPTFPMRAVAEHTRTEPLPLVEPDTPYIWPDISSDELDLPTPVHVSEPSPTRTRVILATLLVLALVSGGITYRTMMGSHEVPITTAEPTEPPTQAAIVEDLVDYGPPAPVDDVPPPEAPTPKASHVAPTAPSPAKAAPRSRDVPASNARRGKVQPSVAMPRVDDLVPDPEPIAQPRIWTTAPEPVVAKRPAPAKTVTPPPAPAPAPVQRLGWVRVATGSNAKRVQVSGSSGSYELPAEVPPGAYKVMAEFVSGIPQYAGDVTVVADRSVQVRCANGLCGALR